ncbi:MAG: STAS domain-containing protein [bacterium]|nr:STAS domain-containing protein [bacterium]
MVEIKIEEKNTIIIIHFSGMLMISTIDSIKEIVEKQLEKEKKVIAFNMRKLDMIDSVAMNFLFKYSKIAAGKKIKLLIYDVNEPIQKVFKVIKLDKVIDIISKNTFEIDYLTKD